MNNKLIGLAITATIVVILTATLLAPVINDSEKQMNPTFENTNANGISLEEVESATISKAAGTSDKVTINGNEISLTTSVNAIVFSDSFVINARTANFYVITATSATNVNQATAFTATIENNTISYTIGTGTEQTVTYSGPLLVASPNGNYINILSGKVYTDALDKVFCWSWINDALYTSQAEECTIAGVDGATTALDAQKDTRYTEVYTVDISNIELDSEDSAVTPVSVIVPTEVKAYATGFGNVATSLFSVLPLLVLVSLVIMMVGAAVLKRE